MLISVRREAKICITQAQVNENVRLERMTCSGILTSKMGFARASGVWDMIWEWSLAVNIGTVERVVDGMRMVMVE